MKRTMVSCSFLSLVVVLSTPFSDALACGNQMHAWITMRALEHVEDPDLKAFLENGLTGAQSRDFEAHLRNGTMFPDSGYAYQITSSTYSMACPTGSGYEERDMVMRYGEIAHWEQFQLGYLEQFKLNHPLPTATPDAELEFAFLLGMTSHGMADQIYDGVLMKGSKHHDATTGWGPCEYGEPWPYDFARPVYAPFDSATDILWTALEGDQDIPRVSFPGDALVRTFEADYEDYLELGLSECEFSHFTENSHESLPGNNTGAGLDIESEELFWNGINLVGFGMELVKGWAEDDQDLGQARMFYPWAQERFEMTESYGAPESIARFTAKLWETIYREAINDQTWKQSTLLGSFPADGGYEHPISSESPTSNVSLVFARQVQRGQNFEELIRWSDSDGNPVVFQVEHVYGANILNLRPNSDLLVDTEYQIEIISDLQLKHDLTARAGTAFSFSTGVAPEPEPTADSDNEGGGCASTGGLGLPILFAALLLRRRRQR